MKKRKMFRTTTLIVSILVVAVLLIGAYFLIYRNVSDYNNKMDIVQNDLLVNFQNEVDDTLTSGKDYISSWCMEEDIIKFVTEEQFDSSNLLRIYNRIGERYFPLKNADCIYGLFREDKDMFITNVGIIHAANLEKNYDFVPDLMNYIQDIPEQKFANNYYLANDSSATGKRINLFIKRTLPNGEAEVYGFISLSLEKIVSQLSQSDDNVFMVYKDDECLFSSSPKAKLKNLNTMDRPSNAVHNLNYKIGMKKHGGLLLWSIYILLCFVLTGIGLFGSNALARFLYRPVENVIRQLADGKSLDIYDEESYISNYFVEMKEINQQLSSQISTQESYFKQNYVRELLYGMVNNDSSNEKMSRYGIDELCGNITMAVLAETKSNARGVLMSNQIIALLTTKIENSYVVFLNAEQIAVIAKGYKVDTFKTLIAQAILQIGEWYDVNYIGSVSEGEIDSPNELCGVFNDTVRYLQNEDFSYDKLVVTKDDFSETDEINNYYYPLDYEKNIISSMMNNEFDHAMQMIKMILDKNLVEIKLNKAAMIELKFAFVNTIKRTLQALKQTEAEVFGEGSILYLELSMCETADEISAKVCEMFATIHDFTENICNNTGHILIDKMEEYIQSNYHNEEMSLFFLAEHFNLTASYISKIFKKHKQENFKDYLVQYRIQKAVEILEEKPYIRIADLAKMVGYSNVNSFIRNFKKLKNISPGEYKNHK